MTRAFMKAPRGLAAWVCAALISAGVGTGALRAAELGSPAPSSADAAIQALQDKMASQQARLEELERRLAMVLAHDNMADSRSVAIIPAVAALPVAHAVEPAEPPAPTSEATPSPLAETTAAESMDHDAHDHMMNLPGGGPSLKFRGYFDFAFDTGSVAQNLQYPLGVPAYSSFRTGEFDLFMSSQLSPKLSFLAELVTSTGPNNVFGVDLERYQLTYRQNKYLALSAGRYHTSIGYYNTAYHHGTWFSTATGRPFMYYFEDSGGVLPVHEVGMSATGAVPSGSLNLHWVAEIGNGTATAGANSGDGVQNFVSDRNHKDVNFAGFVRPDWAPGLQVGGSYLRGMLRESDLTPVNQAVSSLYAVYLHGRWEFLNEAVLMQHELGNRTWNSPMGYTQLAFRVGEKYRPYFRFQEVNVPGSDPVSPFVGRYEGPSVGLRTDIFDYAAFKVQYNRVFTRNAAPQNGLETSISFAF